MRTAFYFTGLLIATLASVAVAAAQGPVNNGENTGSQPEAAEIVPNAPAGENQPAPNDPPQRPLATRQTAFSLPYSIDAAALAGTEPVEVQLLVSADRGRRWSLYLKQRPENRKFNFRASGDGEFWFALRTIDAQNRSHPEGQLQPEVKIVVDTRPPKFELSASVGPGGEIRTAWNIFDPTLAPESFKLEYRPVSSQEWQSVFSEPYRADGQPGTLVGEHTFSAKSASLVVDLRGEVRDDAGNSATATKRVYLPRPSREATERTATKPVEGLLSGLAGLAKGPFKPEETTSTPPDPFALRRPAPIDIGDSASTTGGPIGAPPASTPYGIDAPRDSSPAPFTIPPGGTPAIVAGPLPSGTAASPTAPAQEWLPAPPPTENRVADVRQYPPAKAPTQPPGASRFASNTRLPQEAAESLAPELPPGEKPSFTTARHFNLDYDTDSVGPSGVATVELWGTSDGGRTWTKWGVDADKQSPIRVDVEGDGTYGFRVVVESGLGLAGPRPHSGDPADMWVAVDGNKPKARLTSAIFGTGEFVGQLDIRWEADDENLSQRPVTLAFSEQPAGPWTTIAAGLPNDGRYLWNADPRLPKLVYLRLEVRDEAGNIGEHLLTDPISTEGLSPKGRIRGVRPIDDDSPSAAARQPIRS